MGPYRRWAARARRAAAARNARDRAFSEAFHRAADWWNSFRGIVVHVREQGGYKSLRFGGEIR